MGRSRRKISGFSLGKIYATFNLQTMVKSKMFDYMSDEEFKKFLEMNLLIKQQTRQKR